MPVPKRKTSKRRRDQRSANKGIQPKAFSGCLTCQAPIAAHQVCKECGYYKGVKILQTKTDRMHKRAQVQQTKMAQSAAHQPTEQSGSSAASE